jgi:uncharacterized protein YciI
MPSTKVTAGGTEYTLHGLDKLECWEAFTGWIESTRRDRICRGVNEKDREAVRQRERGLDRLADAKAEGKLDYAGEFFLEAFNTESGFRKALEICVDAKDKAAAVAAMEADEELGKTLYRHFAEASGFFVQGA